MTQPIDQLLLTQLRFSVPSAVAAMADHVRQRHQHACAVLAYGSALRGSAPAETLIDLYVLTRSYNGVSANLLSRLACAIVPPNVYYAELTHGGKVYRAKYAVLPLAQLEARVQASTSNPYFWARFSQPMRLVWRADADGEKHVLRVISAACVTAWANALATSPNASPAERWSALFRETYKTELRPESADRADTIVEANSTYYASITAKLAEVPAISPRWPMRQIAGKLLSILRLAKAAFTFQGGADYIAWKIKRHSGVDIHVTDFHRRHPLLAGLILLPQLLRRGAIR